jgi:hypothetical protein
VFSQLANTGPNGVDLAGLADTYRRSIPTLAHEVADEFDKVVQKLGGAIPKAFTELEQARTAGTLPATLEEYRSQSGVRMDLLEDRVYAFAFHTVRKYGDLLGYGPVHIQEYLLTGSPQTLAVRSEDEYRMVAEDWRKLLG